MKKNKNEIEIRIKECLEQEFELSINSKMDFNYVKTIVSHNNKNENIFSGQIIKFNFNTKEIIIADIKKFENHFDKSKEYGPYSFFELGFSNEIIFIIKMLSFISELNISIDNCIQFPKYIISNRERICENCSLNNETSNLLKLWKIEEKYYDYDSFISIYNQLLKVAINLFGRIKNRKTEYEQLWNEYMELGDIE